MFPEKNAESSPRLSALKTLSMWAKKYQRRSVKLFLVRSVSRFLDKSTKKFHRLWTRRFAQAPNQNLDMLLLLQVIVLHLQVIVLHIQVMMLLLQVIVLLLQVMVLLTLAMDIREAFQQELLLQTQVMQII